MKNWLLELLANRVEVSWYIQSTFDISKSNFFPNYSYLKVNFLVQKIYFETSETSVVLGNRTLNFNKNRKISLKIEKLV